MSGELARRVREKVALSQRDFAKAIGVSFVTVSRWEAGTSPPSGTAVSLLRILDHDPNQLKHLIQRQGEAMSIHQYDEDIRNPPESRRGGRFKVGWKSACAGEEFTATTLETLTWENMGWRMGKLHGEASDQIIESFFEVCSKHWREKNPEQEV